MKEDQQIDDAIDRAARQMLSAEPRADLSARVLGRIAGRKRPPFWSIPRYAVAGAFAMLCVVAALMFKGAHAPTPVTTPVRTELSKPPATSTSVSREGMTRTSAEPSSTLADYVRPAQVGRRRSGGPGLSLISHPEPTVTVAPLTEVGEIAVAQLAPEAIAMPEIVIAALAPAEEVTVKPLYPPDARD